MSTVFLSVTTDNHLFACYMFLIVECWNSGDSFLVYHPMQAPATVWPPHQPKKKGNTRQGKKKLLFTFDRLENRSKIYQNYSWSYSSKWLIRLSILSFLTSKFCFSWQRSLGFFFTVPLSVFLKFKEPAWGKQNIFFMFSWGQHGLLFLNLSPFAPTTGCSALLICRQLQSAPYTK